MTYLRFCSPKWLGGEFLRVEAPYGESLRDNLGNSSWRRHHPDTLYPYKGYWFQNSDSIRIRR
jgi:hypothetical protein